MGPSHLVLQGWLSTALEYGGLADGHYLGLTPHLDFTGACVVQREVVEMQAQLRRWRVRILSHAAACT